jgi:hypothetical protein
MKKILVFILLGFASFVFLAGNSVYAADEVIDLYPYNNIACLEATAECLNTKVGSDHWNFTYGGYRYHAVRGSVRYASEFEDDNNDGVIDALEITGISWGSFGSTIINNTDETVVLKANDGAVNRISLYSSARHDVYMHFDENGVLQMFEAAVETFYIHNTGTTEAPVWRFATEAEIDAYDDAENPEVETPNTVIANIRMALDDADPKGYVLERIKFTQMIKFGVDTATEPESAWSDVVAGNPVDITLPAGWTVMSFAFLDRTSNAKNLAFIMSLPETMLDDTVDPMEAAYVHQPPVFTGITALDDDLVTPGVNIVVEFNGDFDLDPTITAKWVKMFDATGAIINETEFINYSVDIMQDDVVLETIDFTYDEVEDEYTASGPVTMIDSSVFGSGYIAVWYATTPEGDTMEVEADVVIGVMPPKFVGVADRYINQSTPVDLLHGITADGGYNNDVTDTIVVTYPANLNTYNPFPGTYEIGLEFTHNVFIAGIQTAVTVKGEYIALNPDTDVNQNVATTTHPKPMVFTDQEIFRGIGSGWGSVLVKVAADGTMMERYDRYNWEHTTSEGTTVGTLELFTAWQAAMTLENGEFMVTAHGSVEAPRLRAANLSFGDPVTFEPGTADFDTDIITTTSYTLTVDDLTAPILVVVNNNYKVEANAFTTVNQAILANVVAFDFTDPVSALSMYVSNNGGMTLVPGTYTVEVTVEDAAGNSAVQSFNVTVIAPKLTEAEVQALLDAQALTQAEIQAMINASTLTEAQIQALIASGTLTEAEIQAMIDAANEVPETGCGSSLNIGSSLFIVFSLVIGASIVFIIRKRS